MKTAIQIAIENIDQCLNADDTKDMLINLLEKEKEQIIDFSMQMHKIDCSKTGIDILLDEAEQYYNQTYNQKK